MCWEGLFSVIVENAHFEDCVKLEDSPCIVQDEAGTGLAPPTVVDLARAVFVRSEKVPQCVLMARGVCLHYTQRYAG